MIQTRCVIRFTTKGHQQQEKNQVRIVFPLLLLVKRFAFFGKVILDVFGFHQRMGDQVMIG